MAGGYDIPGDHNYLEAVAASKNKQRPKGRPQQKPVAQRRVPQARQREASSRRQLPAWPVWVWAWIGATVLFFLLRAGGAIRSVPLCLFLSAVAGSLFFSLDQVRTLGPAHPLLRARQIALVGVLMVIPSLFDPSTVEIDNLPRLVVIVMAAVFVLTSWAVDAAWNGWRPRRLLNGLQWVLLAIVVWFGVTTLTSVEPRQSFLGRYGSYEGFLLLAALAVLTSGLAETFTFEMLPALFRVIVAAAVPVLLYGAIQVYGFDVHKGSNPDFVPWHNAFHNVFASFGNPNHLGGYLVTILPLGVVTAVLTRHRWVRVGVWFWVALSVVLLLQTAARGAWLGGLAGGAILVVGLLPRLRARARSTGLVLGGAVVVVIILIAGGSRFLGAKASALLHFGAGSSVSQRYGYWSAALRLAGHHPVVGTGPDTFAVTYARYQDAALAHTLGTSFFVNGVHNILLSWLANEGIPGFVLIVALFLFALAWGKRAWTALKARAQKSVEAAETVDEDQAGRIVVVALVAGLVAYFVQASFDVEQVATLFILFVMLGLLGTANRGIFSLASLAGSPFHLRGLKTDPDAPVAEQDDAYPLLARRVGAYGRSASRSQDDGRRLISTVVAVAVGLTALGLSFWRTDALWRADHQEWASTQASLESATALNPWEPSYFGALGQAAAGAYVNNPKAADAVAIVQDSVGFLRHDVALDGDNTNAQTDYADALETLAGLQNANKNDLQMALAALHRAQQDDPYNPRVPGLIKTVEKALQSS
jgi:O-antigen ligase